LTRGVPESELHGFAVDAAVCYVVFEDGGDVSLWMKRRLVVSWRYGLLCRERWDASYGGEITQCEDGEE
jgi:hypothetical protein